ncbi:hypothetical protein [Blastochloris viridis]|uniref:Uncharacterized protein n=1 Tax=Blastochloris viridis TaxID=1079 RepID=A0A0H5BNP8_BLAVI|nr:hypothetical protein [Blastochloris viridis]ALK08693.1 hypothetical protein BVIR_901 [Blastochloris viridis]BAR98013.1 hypothetical protein BV133_420 [Blastochloris viridis]CUU41356.1 hypothetical protein BVIRIDIS_03460 [Blastochloris viridis]
MVRIALIVALGLQAGAADASGPVRKTYNGGVVDGADVAGRHIIRLLNRDGRPVDVSAFEGQRLRLIGDLLPGDNFIIVDRPLPLGPCAKGRPRVHPRPANA